VLWRRSLEAALVLSPGIDEPLTLAGTGVDLWDLLAQPTSTDDLVAALAARYGAEPSVVEVDVMPVLSALESIGAIEGVPGRRDPCSGPTDGDRCT